MARWSDAFPTRPLRDALPVSPQRGGVARDAVAMTAVRAPGWGLAAETSGNSKG